MLKKKNDLRTITLVFLSMCSLLVPDFCKAIPDSSVVICIVDLNCDCVMDTLVATKIRKGEVPKLSEIVWGSRSDSTRCDTAWYGGRATSWQSKTSIVYPSWLNARTGVTCVFANTDNYRDLMLSVRGLATVESLRIRDSTTDTLHYFVDTTVSIVVYAQRGLDSLKHLDFMELANLSNDSLVVRRLDYDNDFIDKQRAASGVAVSKLKQDTAILDIPPEETRLRVPVVVQLKPFFVYPNPATAGMIAVNAELDIGKYTLSIYSALGDLISQHEIISESVSKRHIQLVLTNAPSGVYTVVLHSGKHNSLRSRQVSIVH